MTLAFVTDDRAELRESWKRTEEYLDAARADLAGRQDVDLSEVFEYLEHNELGLAFDALVHIGDRREVPFGFWQHLDRAAQEMRLHSSNADGFHRGSAEICRRHLAAGPDARGMSQPPPHDAQPFLHLRSGRGLER